MSTKPDYGAASNELARQIREVVGGDEYFKASTIVDAALGGDLVAFAVDVLIAEGGEIVEWCETHRAQIRLPSVRHLCVAGWLLLRDGEDHDPCRMVERLVFPIPVESAEAKET